MNNPTELQAELVKSLSNLRDKYECTHDDLVRFVSYALQEITYPSVPPEVKPSPTPPKASTPLPKPPPNPPQSLK